MTVKKQNNDYELSWKDSLFYVRSCSKSLNDAMDCLVDAGAFADEAELVSISNSICMIIQLIEDLVNVLDVKLEDISPEHNE